MEKCKHDGEESTKLQHFIESEVNEMVEESKQSLGGPLALVLKVSDVDTVDKKDSDEEGFIMNSEDEAVAFYSNN